METVIAYEFPSKAGLFAIRMDRSGWWHPMFENEDLGGLYPTAQHACDDLAGGHTAWPSCGDPSVFGLPDQIDDWKAVRAR